MQNTGTSLLEAFTAEQIRSHLELLRHAATQQRNTQPPPANPADACKVCGLTKLSFEPPVIYCTMCGIKIKRGQVFYSTPLDASNANDLRVRTWGGEGAGQWGPSGAQESTFWGPGMGEAQRRRPEGSVAQARVTEAGLLGEGGPSKAQHPT
jgi:hypothetical protein